MNRAIVACMVSTAVLPLSFVPNVSGTGIDDCAATDDADGTFEGARHMTLPFVCTGSLDTPAGDLADWYRFDVPAGQTIEFDFVDLTSGTAEFALSGPDGTVAVTANATLGLMQAEVEVAGPWRGSVTTTDAIGPYTIVVSSHPTADPFDVLFPPGDCGDDGDAPADPARAEVLPSPVCRGRLDSRRGDSVDSFRFDAAVGDGVVFELQTSIVMDRSGELRAEFLRPDGTLAHVWWEALNPMVFEADASGRWSLVLTCWCRPFSGEFQGEYDFVLATT